MKVEGYSVIKFEWGVWQSFAELLIMMDASDEGQYTETTGSLDKQLRMNSPKTLKRHTD
jgi:hypothetical protein